jgi:hypothetical protein
VILETRPGDFAPVRRKRVRKWGWTKLGVAIADKLEKRATQQPRKSKAARDRRRAKR